MTNEEKVNLFKSITKEMADLYEKKNSDYGDSFGKMYNEYESYGFGLASGTVPLSNKLERIKKLIFTEENNFESLEDSYIDLASYAVMNLLEFRLRKKKIEIKSTKKVLVEAASEEKNQAIKHI